MLLFCWTSRKIGLPTAKQQIWASITWHVTESNSKTCFTLHVTEKPTQQFFHLNSKEVIQNFAHIKNGFTLHVSENPIQTKLGLHVTGCSTDNWKSYANLCSRKLSKKCLSEQVCLTLHVAENSIQNILMLHVSGNSIQKVFVTNNPIQSVFLMLLG